MKGAGKTLGQFVLLNDSLGKGSFAEVYRGYRKQDKKQVAIKVIKRDQLNDKLMINLSYEIDAMRKIDHPNVVKLYEVHRSRKFFYIVLEYCAGGDLSKFIKKQKGPLEMSIVKKFLYQLAAGLRCLRSMNLVHRDLKPQNILLSSSEGKSADVKIADFGFAREITPDQLAETMCGSPLYMAPEVLNHQKYNEKVDLWSMGVILYEMMTGNQPFPSSNIVVLMQKVARGVVNYPEYLDPSAVELLKGLLQTNPKKRMDYNTFFNHPFVLSHLEMKAKKSGLNKVKLFEAYSFIAPPSEEELKKLNKTRTEYGVEVTVEDEVDNSISDNTLSSMIELNKQIEELSEDLEKKEEDLNDGRSLEQLLKITPTGSIEFPDENISFSSFTCSEDFKMKIDAVEKKCTRCWVIGEVAYIFETYERFSESVVLFTKALDTLYLCFKRLKLYPSSERSKKLLRWIRCRYMEFVTRANILKDKVTINVVHSQSSGFSSSSSENNSSEMYSSNDKKNNSGSLNTATAENILYNYSIKLAGEAAMTDFLMSERNCDTLRMYRRAKLLLEFILYDTEQIFRLNDKSVLLEYIKRFEKIIKHFGNVCKK